MPTAWDQVQYIFLGLLPYILIVAAYLLICGIIAAWQVWKADRERRAQGLYWTYDKVRDVEHPDTHN